MNERLIIAADRLIDWFKSEALPRWLSSGIDPRNGSCFEYLLPNGQPDELSDRRMLTQARQAYVFARAENLGWVRGLQSLNKGILDFVSREGTAVSRCDGYMRQLSCEFQVVDPTYHLFDHAYFIQSSLAAYHTYGNGTELRRAVNILEWLDLRFAHPNGGWREGDFAYAYRTQRSHMAMFEALLHLVEVTRKPQWLRALAELYQLFQRHFYVESEGTVIELFEEDWTPIRAQHHSLMDPSHLLNWAWLLRRYSAIVDVGQGEIAARLYRTALFQGRGCDGLLLKTVSTQGRGLDARRPCEAVAHLIKASFHEATAGNRLAEDYALWGIEVLIQRFVSPVASGLFFDHLEGPDAAPGTQASAANLFHIFNAAQEAWLYRQALQPEFAALAR